ncbi:MAG TPA: MBL fold metallo-hydrolase [Anaerolineales bacterium]|nr:MBL fold metallo-hydrolase [Anaerolineales bacterium]
MEIVSNVHLVPNVIANPYLIMDADGMTLIDTGLPGSASKIFRYLGSLKRSPSDLKRIIITHSDMDHVGSLSALKKASGARVYASAIESEAMAQGKPSRQLKSGSSFRRLLMGVASRLMKAAPIAADEILTEGQVLPILGGLRVLETPGHTPGHISLFSASTGILFTGDSIVSRQEGLARSLPALTWDEARANESARKQAALGARIVCSGHGPVVMDATGKFPMV